MDRIVVVGGGIVGTGLAHALRDAPVDVTLVEKSTLGAGSTAESIAVFDWLLSKHPDPMEFELREQAWAYYEPLIDAGELEYERTGTVLTASDEDALADLRETAETFRGFGLEVEVHPPGRATEHGLAADRLAGFLHTPRGGYLDPSGIVRRWEERARAAGVEVRTGVEVTDVALEGGAVAGVDTSEGFEPADAVVNAAGPWSPEVNGMAGVSLPLKHTHGPILVVQREEPFELPFVVFDDGYYARSEGDRQAFVGHLEKDFESAPVVDPDLPRSVSGEFRRFVALDVPDRIPDLADAEVVNEWLGLRTVTPDGAPVVGPTEVTGFHVATGMSGAGITLAPAVADHLAARLAEGETSAALEFLDPGRF